MNPTSETIEWSQISRCWWTCSEEYLLVDYYLNGDKSNPVIKVYVAKEVMTPPDEFRTSGHKGKLHFGFLHFGDDEDAVFFVLHDNAWGPYQHRFKTNSFTSFFHGVGAKAVSALASAMAAGAAAGSVVPGLGTVVGGVAGVVAASVTDDYFGDYLRYIG